MYLHLDFISMKRHQSVCFTLGISKFQLYDMMFEGCVCPIWVVITGIISTKRRVIGMFEISLKDLLQVR